MINFLFSDTGVWFSAPAILATGFLILQLIMGEIGGDLDSGVDTQASDAQWLSLQTIAAFFMGYGWLGLGALRLLDVGFGIAAIIGVISGIALARLTIGMMRSLLKLQSDANVHPDDAVGLEGHVTVLIPPTGEGSGRVSLVIKGAQHEFSATQTGQTPIKTHAAVRISRADDAAGSVTVEPVG